MKSFPKNFQKVVDYLKDNCDVDVKLGGTTAYLGMGLRRIFIHHNHNLEKNGLYALLHEAGHVLQDDTQFGPNHYKRIDDTEQPKKYNMYQFMNEVNAWDNGYDLALELGIKIDKKSWGKLKEESLLTYYV
jgi:hypothetical protein